MLQRIYIGLGSNLGNRKKNIEGAIRLLEEVLCRVRISDYYVSEPRDYLNQPDFLNMVLEGYTTLTPFSLLKKIKAIELTMGRKHTPYVLKGPREVDIDILLHGKMIIKKKNLTIPHPEITRRKFVLIPLLEINPNLKNPSTGRKYSEYLFELEEQGIYYFSLDRYNYASKK